MSTKIMKKNIFVLAVLFVSNVFCYSQDLTQYLGNGKLYQTSSWNGIICYATFSYVNETVYGDHITSDKIYIYNWKNGFVGYSSSHGSYVEIQHSQYLGTEGRSFSKNMVFHTHLAQHNLCAFTIKGKNLYLVDVYNDNIISVFDSNFSEGTDFAIFVEDQSYPNNIFEPSIWIVNNGYIKVYKNISSHLTSINSVKEEKTNDKMYNLEGVEITNPHNEIYVQGGKKILAK